MMEDDKVANHERPFHDKQFHIFEKINAHVE